MSASRGVRWTILSLVTVLAGAAATSASDGQAGTLAPSPAPLPVVSAPPVEMLELWLRGPFGRVAGGPVEAPAMAEPLGRPLDAYVRRAPLRLETGDPGELTALSVVAHRLDDPTSEMTLAEDVAEFEGPEAPGIHVVVATVVTASGEAGERAWLVEVPDRDPPADGLYDIPAPDVIVESATGSVAGILGDGCYVYLCVESGPAPPPATLDALRLATGEVPLVRLSDASAITAWEGRLSPVGDTRGRSLDAGGVLADTTEEVVALTGLAPPFPGTWRLDLEVTLDRERGWLRTTHRIVAD